MPTTTTTPCARAAAWANDDATTPARGLYAALDRMAAHEPTA